MNTKKAFRVKLMNLAAAVFLLFAVLLIYFVSQSSDNTAYASMQVFGSNPSTETAVNITFNNVGFDEEDSYYESYFTDDDKETVYTSYTGGHFVDGLYTNKAYPYVPIARTIENNSLKYSCADYITTAYATYGGLIAAGVTNEQDSISVGDTTPSGQDYQTIKTASILRTEAMSQESMGDSIDFVFTFAMGDELRKALKDKMLVVSATPYIITYATTFSGQSTAMADGADLFLIAYNGTAVSNAPTSGEVAQSAISVISSSRRVSMPVSNNIILGNKKVIKSGEYGDGAFLQVSLCNWFQNVDSYFTIAIREVGIKLSVTYNTALNISTTGYDGSGNPVPSNNPSDIGSTTTCIVQGKDRHSSAPATYAKANDVLDINLILKTNTSNLNLDTTNYSSTDEIDSVSVANSRDGTMFRRLYLKVTDYLVNWTVSDGAVDESATEISGNNKSGQAIKFKVVAGGANSGQLVLSPIISYRTKTELAKTEGSVATKVPGTNSIFIAITVDSTAPNSPSLSVSGTYYSQYLNTNKVGYYTSIQSSIAGDDNDENGNLVRLAITGGEDNDDTHPLFTTTATDNKGGSASIIYYKTTFMGDEVPISTADKKAVAYTGPTFIYDSTKNAYVVYEGRLYQDGTYYKMTAKKVTSGTVIPSSSQYYVRNNAGDYVRATGTFVAGTTYYQCSEYTYLDQGEYTGIYATVDTENRVSYKSMYINLFVTETDYNNNTFTNTRKTGVWAIEFVAYDYVGNSTMCTNRYFIRVDTTDYEFSVQFSVGGDFENYEVSADNVEISAAAMPDDGSDPLYVKMSQDRTFTFQRTNKISVSVTFTEEAYRSFCLTQFSVGNISFSTTDNVYSNYQTKLNNASFTVTNKNGTTKTIYYTFEVDGSYCMDDNLRRMIFYFKYKTTLQANGTSATYDGTSKSVVVTAPTLQTNGIYANIITKYYTAATMREQDLVQVGDNNSNYPIDAGTYYFMSELYNNKVYYARQTGILTINQAQPKLNSVQVYDLNYGESLAKLDAKTGSGGEVIGATGIYAYFYDNGRDFFCSDMSSDKIPGYYEFVVSDKTQKSYTNPQAGDIRVIVRFTPLKGKVLSDYTVEYTNGVKEIDRNYSVVEVECQVRILHSTEVDFMLDEFQNGGSILNTSMMSGITTVNVRYVSYNYNEQKRSIEYSIKSKTEKEPSDTSKYLNLKDYSILSYAKVNSINLTATEFNNLVYSENEPENAGIYAVRITLDESRCNYTVTEYTYIVIEKVILDLTVNASDAIYDYQYDGIPPVEVRNGRLDYSSKIAGFTYGYYYYVSGVNYIDLCVDENKLPDSALGQYSKRPVEAGNYMLKVEVKDDNYAGYTMVPYTIRQVNNDNSRFVATWPSVNSSQISVQYNLMFGQPLGEVTLGTGRDFSYAYVYYRASGGTYSVSLSVPGKVFIAYRTYTSWLMSKDCSDSEQARTEYINEMQAYKPEYNVDPYAYYMCFSAQSTDEYGNVVYDMNYDFIYRNVYIYVGHAEINWSAVKTKNVTYGDELDSVGFVGENKKVSVSKTLGILCSTSGVIYDENGMREYREETDTNYYLLFGRYLYKYVTDEYTLAFSGDNPKPVSAGMMNIVLMAKFESENYEAEYAGNVSLTVDKKFVHIQYDGSYGTNVEMKTYNCFRDEEFYDNFNYNNDDIVDNMQTSALRGVFNVMIEGVPVETQLYTLTAGIYTVMFVMDHLNYCGEFTFELIVSKSELNITRSPEVSNSGTSVVYEAPVTTSNIRFVGGEMKAEGGETVRYDNGTFMLSAIGVFDIYGGLTRYTDLSEYPTFGNAGTKIRLYYTFIPGAENANKYFVLEGTDENGGYVEMEVNKADISDIMRVKTQSSSYIYKDIVYTESLLKNDIVNYSVTDESKSNLNWTVKLLTSNGDEPGIGNFVNAGNFTILVIVDDNNYYGEKTCPLTIGKRPAYIRLVETAGTAIVEQAGVQGIKKAYKGSSQAVDYQVYEKINGVPNDITESAVVNYFRDVVRQPSAPTAIGQYDVRMSLLSASNYYLCDEDDYAINYFTTFIIIGVNTTDIELTNLDQIYTVQKVVTVYMGMNDAVCTLTFKKNGQEYTDLPTSAGEYEVYLNFASYENNGYSDVIAAADLTDSKGVNRGYKLVIDKYTTEINAPAVVNCSYTGVNATRFTPYTSPYGLGLAYEYRLSSSDTQNEYVSAPSLAALGALNAGTYDVRIKINDNDYAGELVISFIVAKANLTIKTVPEFGEYMYNTADEPEYIGGGAAIFGSNTVDGKFYIPVSSINSLQVGEHTVVYMFEPYESNYNILTGSVKLKIIKQVLPQNFVKLGDGILEESGYSAEYNATVHTIPIKFDTAKINGYPTLNSDFSVNLTFKKDGVSQTLRQIGSYTVTATVSSKNYTYEKTWEHLYTITHGVPKIIEVPTTVTVFKIGDKIKDSDFYGGKAVINVDNGSEIRGTFTLLDQNITLTHANSQSLAMMFVPTDGTNFTSVECYVHVSVIGLDPVTVNGVTVPQGSTLSGDDWLGDVFFPTFTTTDGHSITPATHADGSVCGARVTVHLAGGVDKVEYGITLSNFYPMLVPSDADCETCKEAANMLIEYGSIKFEASDNYVPNAHDDLVIAYKPAMTRIENSIILNNMYGMISTEGLISKKSLSGYNFNLFNLTDSDYILEVKDSKNNDFGIVTFINGTYKMYGAFMNEKVSVTNIQVNYDVDGYATLNGATENYTIGNVRCTTAAYGFIPTEDIIVNKKVKNYDGEKLKITDLNLTVRNTQVSYSMDAYKLLVYDASGNLSEGREMGTYKVIIFINDTQYNYFGIHEDTFTVDKGNISDKIVPINKRVDDNGTYYDTFASGTENSFYVGLINGDAIDISYCLIEAKQASLSDVYYATINYLDAGEYTVRVKVNAPDYHGEATFNYRVDPEKIYITTSTMAYSAIYGSPEQAAMAFPLSFADEDNVSFNFEDRGGYTLYFYSSSYTKQTQKPINAGTYSVSVESNNPNYYIVNNVLTYTINRRPTTVMVGPKVVAIDNDGNNIIYGQKLSALLFKSDNTQVTDSSGNLIEGTFGVSATDANRTYDVGTSTIYVVFTPNNRNYAESTCPVQISVAPKAINVTFSGLSAYYNGLSQRTTFNTLYTVSEEIQIIFTFTNAYNNVGEPIDAGLYAITAVSADSNYRVVLSTTEGTSNTAPYFTIYRAEVNTPLIVAPQGASIGVGESLTKSALTDGVMYYKSFSSPISGTFTYVEGARVFATAGEKEVEYLFTPGDSKNFASYKGKIKITIGKGKATITPGEYEVEYGQKANLSSLMNGFKTSPAAIDELAYGIKCDFTADGITYRDGDIIPAGTYWFTCWIDSANYASEKVRFSYTVKKKVIDIDFLNEAGEVVTAFSVSYGQEVVKSVKLYDENYTDKRTYLLQDSYGIDANLEYYYTARGEDNDYSGFYAPSEIGSYELTVTLSHANYTATNTVIYRVTTGRVTDIQFDVDTLVNQIYGAVTAPIVTTVPSGVSYYIIYQGYDRVIPTAVGTYNITVYIDDDNYASSQMSAVFRINPKPLGITDIYVKDKAYDGVPTLDISGKLTGILFGDEVSLKMAARTYDGDSSVGKHYVEITECVLTGLNAQSYSLEYPTYSNQITIFGNQVNDANSSSYISSLDGFAAGTNVTFRELDTSKNQTSLWSKMLGVEATVTAYTITVDNAEGINAQQYKICVEIPEKYKNVKFDVQFDGALAGQNISWQREGNYISFYSSTASGEVIFQTAEFKYDYVVTAAVLLIVLIAIIVLLILNPLQHRRATGNPKEEKKAIKKIKKG